MKEIIIAENDSNQRLDKFLLKLMPEIPKSLLYKYLRKKCVKINGKHCTEPSTVLNANDKLNLYINEEFLIKNEQRHKVQNLDLLNIVYEDENVIFVNKPAGLSVHPDEKQTDGTLIDIIIAYLQVKGEYNPSIEQSFIPSLCNRIDRNTRGIVIASKNAESLREMNEIIKNREVIKSYRCLVHGCFPSKFGTLTNYIVKDSKGNKVSVYDKPIKDGLTAILDYKIIKSLDLKNGDKATMLDITLHTGRTHQIRAQLSHIGYSIVGDGKYGTTYAIDKQNGYKYQALCAYSLEFKLKSDYRLLAYLNGKKFIIDSGF